MMLALVHFYSKNQLSESLIGTRKTLVLETLIQAFYAYVLGFNQRKIYPVTKHGRLGCELRTSIVPCQSFIFWISLFLLAYYLNAHLFFHQDFLKVSKTSIHHYTWNYVVRNPTINDIMSCLQKLIYLTNLYLQLGQFSAGLTCKDFFFIWWNTIICLGFLPFRTLFAPLLFNLYICSQEFESRIQVNTSFRHYFQKKLPNSPDGNWSTKTLQVNLVFTKESLAYFHVQQEHVHQIIPHQNKREVRFELKLHD